VLLVPLLAALHDTCFCICCWRMFVAARLDQAGTALKGPRSSGVVRGLQARRCCCRRASPPPPQQTARACSLSGRQRASWPRSWSALPRRSSTAPRPPRCWRSSAPLSRRRAPGRAATRARARPSTGRGTRTWTAAWRLRGMCWRSAQLVRGWPPRAHGERGTQAVVSMCVCC
jgi:hypothetical protein